MRINEILTESQLKQLDEGPIGSALGAVGRGIGKVASGVAKGVGAVAGGVVGAGRALKKGYQTGKAIVGDDPDPNAKAPGYTAPAAGAPAAAPAASGAAPAAAPAASGAAPAAGVAPTAQQINKAGPKGTAPAKSQTGAAGQALAKTTAVVDKAQGQSQEKANQTVYAQVKANVDKLDKKGKQRILQLLQKAVAAPAPKPAAPAAKPAAGAAAAPAVEPAAEPAATTSAAEPAAEPAATTSAAEPAAEPAATTSAAAPAAATTTPPATKARGGKVAGQQSQTPNAIRKRNARRDKANAAATTGGAGAFNQMGQQLTQQNASKINNGTALTEMLADRVAVHKQRMFEADLINGTVSVFKK
jgi:hypothetical protein